MSILVHSSAIPVHSSPFWFHSCKFLPIPVDSCVIPVEWIHSCWNQWLMVKFCTSPAVLSQSSDTIHLLPLPSSWGVPLAALLNPSATTLMHPGTWRMSTIWWLRIPLRHLACVALSLSFIKWLCSAWQSVSTSTGNPHMSENLSKVNLSPANSNKKGLYFSSVLDVCFDVNTIGWSFVTVLPLVSTVVNFCANMAQKWRSLQCPLIPAGIRSFLRNPVDSGGMNFSRKACYFCHSGA